MGDNRCLSVIGALLVVGSATVYNVRQAKNAA